MSFEKGARLISTALNGIIATRRLAFAVLARQILSSRAVPRRSQHAIDLVLERVVGRRLGARVHLEVLCDRFDVAAQRIEGSTGLYL